MEKQTYISHKRVTVLLNFATTILATEPLKKQYSPFESFTASTSSDLELLIKAVDLCNAQVNDA